MNFFSSLAIVQLKRIDSKAIRANNFEFKQDTHTQTASQITCI